MTPWIQVYSNMATHPKTYKLVEKLNLKCTGVMPNTIAAGLLVRLWCWAAQNATDGILTGVTHKCIADAAGWTKKADTFWDALCYAGFIDVAADDSGTVSLHDWLDYATLLLEQEENRKEKTTERVRRYRDKKKAKAAQTENAPCNVTDTPCNAPTLSNLTLPNLTSIERKQAKESDTSATSVTQDEAARETYRRIHGHYPTW